MIWIKYSLLMIIFVASFRTGSIISSKYKNRVKELKEYKNALGIFRTKIKFTYEPIADIFKQIADMVEESSVGKVFKTASGNMNKMTAERAWEKALEESNNNINEEDKLVLKKLSKLLGKTSLEGQVSEIEMTNTFLETQIKKAENERDKNEKLYRTLGMTIGLALVVVLI